MAKRKGLYRTNKKAKVGETIECPICNTKFTKRQYSQAFCSTRCKDRFWNAKGDRHLYVDYSDNDFGDREMDEMFGVAEYNIK
jgi:endogenous inhibitor of DNA gyrase (YacG/DUF329 family)